MLTRSGLAAQSQPIPEMAIRGTLGGPESLPTFRIQTFPGVSYYDTLATLVTADGAPLTATTPGHWGQLYAVGGGRVM